MMQPIQVAGLPGSTFKISRFTSKAGLLTKKVSRNPDGGGIIKASGVMLSKGSVETLTLSGMEEFSAVLTSLETSQALSYGVSSRGDGLVMSKSAWEKAEKPKDVILRNRKDFSWPSGCGILMIDYDPPKVGEVMSRDQLWSVLSDIIPGLADAQCLWRPSASSCIYDASTNEELACIGGQRFYILVNDASDIERAGKALFKRLWLAGLGHIEISKSGSLLPRTIIDGAVFQPERLDFAAGADCADGLRQDRGDPVVFGGGGILETHTALPDLSDLEQRKYDALLSKARDASKEEASVIRASWIEIEAPKLATSRDITLEEATRVLNDASSAMKLYPDFELVSNSGERVAVADLLADRVKWHGGKFYDPLEPDDDGRIATAYLLGGQPSIWSFKHGGVRFNLIRTRISVQTTSGGTAHAVAQVLDALRTSGEYFDHADTVATINNGGQIRHLNLYSFKHGVESLISFEKFDYRRGALVPSDCPDEIAKRVLSLQGMRGLPTLRGVIDAPTMHPDGRLIARCGLDDESGLFLLDQQGDGWPNIPDRPTKQQVMESLATLWAPFSLFPFRSAVDRAVMLAALLTACVRRPLPTAPAFMVAAPAAGSGKTLLASCIGALAGGSATMSLPDDEAELTKTLVAVLRKGAGVVFFDNVTRAVDSKSLNAVLTSPDFDGRILGVSETTGALPTNALFVLTGNNALPVGDTCRRMLVCYLDAEMERPFNRKFAFNPLDMIRAKRQEYVAAGLTILRGWITSDMNSVAGGGLASFDEWERLVRQAVVWVGQMEAEVMGEDAVDFGDPIAGIEEMAAADPEGEAFSTLLAVWAHTTVDSVTSSELFKLLLEGRSGMASGDRGALAITLAESIPFHVRNAMGLGRWLAARCNKIAAGLKLISFRDKKRNASLWCVRSI